MCATPDQPVTANPTDMLLADLFGRFPALAPLEAAVRAGLDATIDIFQRGGILYLCGNGGSFADAIHIKGELTKSFASPRPLTDAALTGRLAATDIGRELLANLEMGLPVVVLGESHSLRSAYANDRDPVWCYAQELHAFADSIPHGLLLALSTSGKARNVLGAATLAQAYGMKVISLTGPDGGPLARMADIAWRTPGTQTFEVQEFHLPLYHTFCLILEARLFGTAPTDLGGHA